VIIEVTVNEAAGYEVRYNPTDDRLLVYSGAGVEVADATDLSGTTLKMTIKSK
jgi:hypothetical protein